MPRSCKLDPALVDSWLVSHPGWERAGAHAIGKRFGFPDFAAAVAFAVRIACLADKRDHHPEVELAWGRAHVIWWTHDADGVTQLDLDAAEATDAIGR
jgi:4a-hydroxytetrahydrobiopterin dehydratase